MTIRLSWYKCKWRKIEYFDECKHCELHLDICLDWNHHINHGAGKISKSLWWVMKHVWQHLNLDTAKIRNNHQCKSHDHNHQWADLIMTSLPSRQRETWFKSLDNALFSDIWLLWCSNIKYEPVTTRPLTEGEEQGSLNPYFVWKPSDWHDVNLKWLKQRYLKHNRVSASASLFVYKNVI